MQNLHLVGFTTDRRHLIFSTRRGAKSGSFLVPVDDELIAVVGDIALDAERADEADESVDEEVVAAPPPRVEAKLSVREVQARLRAGESVPEVAADAGVAEEWVERFAPPVRAEQRQVVERALGLPMERSRAGESAKPLGVAVASAMAERGVTFTDEGFASAWTSRLIGQDHWVIEFHFTQRGRRRSVGWTFDADVGRITTSDRTASQIGFVAPPTPPAKATSRSGARAPKSPGQRSSDDSDGDDENRTGPRSTRGDGRPDTVRSTKAVAAAAAATEKALATRPAARKPAVKKKAPPKKKAAPKKKPAVKKKAAPKKGAKKKAASKKKPAVKKKAAPKKAASPKQVAADEQPTDDIVDSTNTTDAPPAATTAAVESAPDADAPASGEGDPAPVEPARDETTSEDAAHEVDDQASALPIFVTDDEPAEAPDEAERSDEAPRPTAAQPDTAENEPRSADSPAGPERMRVRLRGPQDAPVAPAPAEFALFPDDDERDDERDDDAAPPVQVRSGRPTAAFRSGAAVHAGSSVQSRRPAAGGPAPQTRPALREDPAADTGEPAAGDADHDHHDDRPNGRRTRRTRQLRAR